MLASTRNAAFLTAAIVLLAGCGASQPPIATSAAMPQGHRDTGPSWMARGAQAENLLYVSDEGAETVHIYAYPSGASMGKLTGFDYPSGLCLNESGDVWIVNADSKKIIEYAHAGTKPIATLNDSNARDPLSCAVDRTTGNLAVSDLGAPKGGGGVWVYAGAKGSPTRYTSLSLVSAYFAGYDPNGNLFVDGVDSAGAFSLMELPSGSSKLESIKLNSTVGFPGGVQWHSGYLVIGDQAYKGERASAIYLFSISGTSGTIAGTTALAGSCDVLQFDISSIAGGTMAGPDGCENNVRIYKYPGGGSQKTLTGLRYPTGAAISPPQ